VRIIEADVAITGSDGSRTGDRCRLITTLTDHRRFPALELARLYHQRREIESAYYALRCTLLNGHVLRSGDRSGLEQEIWALLTLYQLLRMAMTDATSAQPGTDPDRASFTTALEAARDQLTAAAGVSPPPPPGPAPSARRSWPPCCPPGGRVTAPASSNAPPPATTKTTTPGPGSPRRSPRSASRCTPRRWEQAHPAAPGTPPRHHGRPSRRPGVS